MAAARTWKPASLALLCAAAAVALVAGWWTFWFLCDDAFIAYRYVHHLVNGNGLVWNPAPFAPVEGYTSFLWVCLLALVWGVTGASPPESSNWLLLLASLGSLALVVRMGLALRLSERLRDVRLGLLALVLFGMLSNRTFLAWTSSGLEQGLFTLAVLGWVYTGCFIEPGRRQLGALAVIASLMSLVRPDGMLFVATSGLLISLWLVQRGQQGRLRAADGLPLLAFALPILHLLWRWSYYGEWLPNTYYAKHVAPWPEAGLRYVASFALEYAYFCWLPLAGFALVRFARSQGESSPQSRETVLVRTAVVFTVFGHFAYYTFRVGGDYFEYRIYHHLVPLLMLMLLWLVDRCGMHPRPAFATMGLSIALGLPLPWVHFARTHDLASLHQDGLPFVPIADQFPAPLRAWPEQFDRLQEWLVQRRSIGVRHRTHQLFLTGVQQQRFPPRQDGMAIDFGDDIPLMQHRAVGYPGWVVPQLMILDGLGLNDAVIARNPTQAPHRRMAHDRSPPVGYVECLLPNVDIRDQRVTVNARPRKLTPERVRDCETRFRAKVDEARRGG
jgi:arabinofuranosyltransferase